MAECWSRFDRARASLKKSQEVASLNYTLIVSIVGYWMVIRGGRVCCVGCIEWLIHVTLCLEIGEKESHVTIMWWILFVCAAHCHMWPSSQSMSNLAMYRPSSQCSSCCRWWKSNPNLFRPEMWNNSMNHCWLILWWCSWLRSCPRQCSVSRWQSFSCTEEGVIAGSRIW